MWDGLVSWVLKGPPCSPAPRAVGFPRGLCGHFGAPGLGHHHLSPQPHAIGGQDVTQGMMTVFVSAVH